LKTLREALRSEELTLTAELALSPHLSSAQVIGQAKILAETADAIQIPDHRHARPHLSNIATAALLLQNGMDPVVHMNCRDRNRVALQSDLLGAQALGVNNLLLSRGTNFPDDHRPRSTGVFDIGAIDLIATAASIRDGEIFATARPPEAQDLYIGTVATAFNPADGWEPETLTSKADAGAQFIQLQLCFNMELLRAYMARIVASKLTWRFQTLVGLAVLPSANAARELRKARPDSVIPSAVVERLEQATDPEAEGVQIAAELLQEIVQIPGLAGVNLVTPGEPESIPAAIRASGVRPKLGK
jgi:methylenetetrahydrofolate reductase (NADPH)